MGTANSKEKGFTLIELMISIAIFGVVIAAVYTLFESQQKTYVAQQEVVDVQQGIRASMDFLASEMFATIILGRY